MMSVFFNTTLHTILSPLYHPLNSTIFLEIFVVHGGLSRGAPGSFLRLLGKPTHGTHGERLAAGWYSVSEVPGGCGWFMFSLKTNKLIVWWGFIWCWEITISGISLWLYLGFMMIYENIEGLIGRKRTWARSLDRNAKAISPDLPNGHIEHWLCVYRMWWQILDLSDTILGWRLDG